MSEDDSSDEERKRVAKVDEYKDLRKALREQYEPFLNDQRLTNVFNGRDPTGKRIADFTPNILDKSLNHFIDANTLSTLKTIQGILYEKRLPRSVAEAEERLEALRQHEYMLTRSRLLFNQILVSSIATSNFPFTAQACHLILGGKRSRTKIQGSNTGGILRN